MNVMSLDHIRIQDETDPTDVVVVNQRAYGVSPDVAKAVRSQQNLLRACRKLLNLALLVGHIDHRDRARYQTSGQVLIHGDQMRECANAVDDAQGAIHQATGKLVTEYQYEPELYQERI
jgi:hypothetical protein